MLQSRALAMHAVLSSHTESSSAVIDMLERCVALRQELLVADKAGKYQAAAAKSHWKLADFNDQMFTHIESQHVENKQQRALLKRKPAGSSGRLHGESLNFLDEKYALMQKQRAEYLKAALRHYMQCIEHDVGGAKHQGVVFRILYLWFANLEVSEDDDEQDKELRDDVAQLLTGLFETTKDLSAFAGVARQVLSRLDDNQDKDRDQKPMRVLLGKLLEARPHELLWATFYVASLDGKKKSAGKLIDELSRKNHSFGELVKQTKMLKDAYIELAKCSWCRAQGHQQCVQRNNGSGNKCGKLCEKTLDMSKFSKEMNKFVRKGVLEKVRVPTVASQCHTGEDEALIVSFERSVVYPGGITQPKKIVCTAANGREYTQIVKSEDPRGDVVLSQIFSLVNVHFSRDTKCRQRQLSLGTYSVVALGDKSCVLEFVKDASPLSKVLGAGTAVVGGLHERYAAAGEWSYKTCSGKIEKNYNSAAGKTNAAQLAVYKDVCSHCFPVFRHYFAESTRSASEWFALRLTYTRSVASSSMAGHIVGLGDRHLTNIMIRETGPHRGALVHIDLGLIFEQARHLPRPELVPFRLTRDMIDGMGLAGTDGVMSRCAEESLRVMRENKYALLSIVDVLLHDPLESWKMSDQKREQRRDAAQGGDDGMSNIDARIIRKTIKDKLEGWVRGELLGVQGQVKQLISEATSPENLSLLFQGWCAWY